MTEIDLTDYDDGMYLIADGEITPLFTDDFNIEATEDIEAREAMHLLFDQYGLALTDIEFLRTSILLEETGLKLVKKEGW